MQWTTCSEPNAVADLYNNICNWTIIGFYKLL